MLELVNLEKQIFKINPAQEQKAQLTSATSSAKSPATTLTRSQKSFKWNLPLAVSSTDGGSQKLTSLHEPGYLEKGLKEVISPGLN